MAAYKDYPPCIDQRSGAKVGWRTYATKRLAEKAAKAARHNAEIQASLGYDFGYQMPGSIDKTAKGYEVCIP